MSKKLRITIAGEPGSGKTTIAAGLTAVLADAGIRINVDDPDMNGMDDVLNEHFKSRVASLVEDGLEITIETVAVRSEPTTEPDKRLH